jgi:hypothetical protein
VVILVVAALVISCSLVDGLGLWVMLLFFLIGCLDG